MKNLFAAFFFFVLSICISSPVLASENFSSSYNVTYSVLENGSARANFAIDLTNNTSRAFASSYKLTLGFDTIENIKASDPDGAIDPIVEKTDEGYAIDLRFNKKVVGIGNTLPFTLSFDTKDIVQKQGAIWEVNIPGISNQNDFSHFNVMVNVPKFLGSPTYIKPQQPTNALSFTKQQLGKSGISIAFGEYQVYNFNLTYHIKNPNLFPVKTEIALPPSTNYQDVVIDSISIPPSNVAKDQDGNWLAEYYLKSAKNLDVVVKGSVKLSLYPKTQLLSESQRKQYLKERPYWETSNNKLKELAKKLKTPENIYNYVVDTLVYDFSRVTSNKKRVGAAELLDNPTSAVCLEFTDLFVALARAAGIPAREVDGFAYTENAKQRPLSLVKDILHAWPEYYDDEKKTWIMVDPTWGNTTKGVDYFHTFDFDHIVFVIKGKDSSYPIPAGGYKLEENLNSKDIAISFSDSFRESPPTLELTPKLPSSVLAGFPIGGEIQVKNIGKVLFPQKNVIIETKDLSPQKQEQLVPDIPPFGFVTVPISFQKTSLLENKKADILLRIGNDTILEEIQIIPFYGTKWGIGGGVLIGIFTIIILIITAKTRSVPIPKQGR